MPEPECAVCDLPVTEPDPHMVDGFDVHADCCPTCKQADSVDGARAVIADVLSWTDSPCVEADLILRRLTVAGFTVVAPTPPETRRNEPTLFDSEAL
jgi:hypothetical protein